jgi:hypothetical protein
VVEGGERGLVEHDIGGGKIFLQVPGMSSTVGA